MNRQGSSSTCGGYYDSKSVEIKVTRRVKEAIHIGLHLNNINRDRRIEIPEAWMPTIKKHNNRRALRQWTAEGANHWVKQQGSKCTNQSCWKKTNHSRASCLIGSRMTSWPQQYAVETSRSTSHETTSWDKRKKLSFYCKELFPLALIAHQSLSCWYLNWVSLFLISFIIFKQFSWNWLVK